MRKIIFCFVIFYFELLFIKSTSFILKQAYSVLEIELFNFKMPMRGVMCIISSAINVCKTFFSVKVFTRIYVGWTFGKMEFNIIEF